MTPFCCSCASQRSADACRATNSIGEPSRGVAGIPAFPHTVEDPGASVRLNNSARRRARWEGTVFIHPSAAIKSVPTPHEPGGGVNADADVEALIPHVTVEAAAGVVLPVRHSVQVMLQNIDHHREHGTLLAHRIPGNRRL
jgi:hypothetical protein